ncbi:MAG: DUF58 domain-containing protein [Chloroflexi bacterium]|nr:DUF58 domain-containing protein [Chloroflexota bacterium]
MRYWLLLSLVAALVIGLGSGFELLFRLAFLIAVLLIVGPIWAWARLRGVRVTVERGAGITQVGDRFSQRVTLSHHGRLPRPLIEFREPSDLPGHQTGAILNLREDGSRSWKATTECRQRGRFTLGPAVIVGSDPFGLFRVQRRVAEPFSLLVFPRQVEVPGFALPSSALPEHGHRQRRGNQASTSAVTIRDYAPGDGFHRIHWPSTARLGKLMVKEFELETSSDLWLVLDLDRRVQRGQGEKSTEEYLVTIAASLAGKFLRAEYSVGLLVGGASPVLVPGGRGSRQLRRILEALAEARATGDGPLAQVLGQQGHHLDHNSTVVVITPSWESDWPEALGQLVRRGTQAVGILVEASTFGEAPVPAAAGEALATTGVPTYWVDHGDNLAAALARPRSRASAPRPDREALAV